MKLLSKIVRSFRELYAEKKAKFINASQQAFFFDQREAALKNLMNPKAKLSGAMKRRLLEQTGRPLDASEGYVYTAPKNAGDKWFARLCYMPMRRLIRWDTRSKHRVTGAQIQFDKAGPRSRRLLQPKLDFLKMIQQVVSEVVTFRQANVRQAQK